MKPIVSPVIAMPVPAMRKIRPIATGEIRGGRGQGNTGTRNANGRARGGRETLRDADDAERSG
jgi:hypothetical protein